MVDSLLRRLALTGLIATVAFPSCGSHAQEPAPPSMVRLGVQVLDTHPHDPDAYTEGLEFVGPVLYESVGLHKRSELRVVNANTGTVQRRVALAENQWAEGMTVVGSTIWQITYREQVALSWDRETLTPRGQRAYSGEGWGLCYQQSQNRLVMSNGSDRLTFRDPVTFAAIDSVKVHIPELTDAIRLNELECVDNDVWAVLFPTPRLVRIDVTTGHATALVDVSGLLTPQEAQTAMDFNGIAAIPGTDKFLLTGKFWPKMFTVRFTSNSE